MSYYIFNYVLTDAHVHTLCLDMLETWILNPSIPLYACRQMTCSVLFERTPPQKKKEREKLSAFFRGFPSRPTPKSGAHHKKRPGTQRAGRPKAAGPAGEKPGLRFATVWSVGFRGVFMAPKAPGAKRERSATAGRPGLDRVWTAVLGDPRKGNSYLVSHFLSS